MKKKLLLLICLISLITHAQEKWLVSDIKYETETFKPKNIIPVVNEDTNNIALFFANRKVIFGKLYDNEKRLIGTINNINIPKKGKEIIGAIYNNSVYTLFFSNTNKTRFSSVSMVFDTQNFDTKEYFSTIPNKEKVMEFLVAKNKLHILTINKKESILKNYTLTEKGHIDTFEYNLENEKIINFRDQNISLYNLFGNIYPDIELINNNVPNSLEQTNALTKLYLNENTVTITNNNVNKYTYIFTLDLNKNDYQFQSIINTGYNKDHLGANSNSYVFKNKLLTIYSTLDNLSFSAYKTEDLELIKSYSIERDHPIDFKNTPIIQEGGELDNYRELEKTSKFLRKITQSKIGVTGFTKNNKLIITLGASKEVYRDNFALGNFGFIGGVVSGLLTSTFYEYSQTKSTRISCVFDNDLNHINGEVPFNDFDKIQEFKSTNSNFAVSNLETLFKFNSSYLLGNYNKKNGFYTLYKFD